MCLCRLRIPIERQLWETRAAPRPTYLWSGTCPLQLRAYTQIPSCRRISSGLIAQVALLPFRGGGPPSPRGQHPILGLRKRVPYSTVKCNDYGEYIEYWAGIHGWQVKIWKVIKAKGILTPLKCLFHIVIQRWELVAWRSLYCGTHNVDCSLILDFRYFESYVRRNLPPSVIYIMKQNKIEIKSCSSWTSLWRLSKHPYLVMRLAPNVTFPILPYL